MNKNKNNSLELSKLLAYLAALTNSEGERVPSLTVLSRRLGLSVATLREQLEVARFLGIVEVKPKTGIKTLPYCFKPAVFTSLTFAVESGQVNFQKFMDLRKHLEAAYFIDAARQLSLSELKELTDLVRSAQAKMNSNPPLVPVTEHRDFHLLIYQHIENPFFKGIIESFWDYYRIGGFDVYPDLTYLERVWKYHAEIVDFIKEDNLNQALSVLLEHMDLINQRDKVSPRLSFE